MGEGEGDENDGYNMRDCARLGFMMGGRRRCCAFRYQTAWIAARSVSENVEYIYPWCCSCIFLPRNAEISPSGRLHVPLIVYQLQHSKDHETPSRRSVSPRTTIAGLEYSAVSPTNGCRSWSLYEVLGIRVAHCGRKAQARHPICKAALSLLVIQAIHGPDFSLRVLVTASNEHQVVPCMHRALILSLLLLVGLGPLGVWLLKGGGSRGWLECLHYREKGSPKDKGNAPWLLNGTKAESPNMKLSRACGPNVKASTLETVCQPSSSAILHSLPTVPANFHLDSNWSMKSFSCSVRV